MKFLVDGGGGGGGGSLSRLLAAGGSADEDHPPTPTKPTPLLVEQGGVTPGVPLKVVTTKTITFEADKDDVSVMTGRQGCSCHG